MSKSNSNLIKKIILIVTLLLFTNSVNSAELYSKFGIFDYKHRNSTDALALNFKVVSDTDFNLPFLGELNQIYEFTGLIDKNNVLSDSQVKETANTEEYAVYLSTGLAKKINLSESFSIVPSFSWGFYQEFDHGKDMGLPLEFKSEVEFNFNIFSNSVIGFTWNHISNADIGDKNPGSDSILFGFRIKENF